MKKITLLSAFSLILLITACSSNPMDRKFSEATFKEDAKAMVDAKKLNEEDAKLMIGYMLRAKIRGEKLEEMTYAEMLTKAKELKKELQATE
jgi:hypothetical protein